MHCPTCGSENPPEADACGMCGFVFGRDSDPPTNPGLRALLADRRVNASGLAGSTLIEAFDQANLLLGLRTRPPGLPRCPEEVSAALPLLLREAPGGDKFLLVFTDLKALARFDITAEWIALAGSKLRAWARGVGFAGCLLNPDDPEGTCAFDLKGERSLRALSVLPKDAPKK